MRRGGKSYQIVYQFPNRRINDSLSLRVVLSCSHEKKEKKVNTIAPALSTQRSLGIREFGR